MKKKYIFTILIMIVFLLLGFSPFFYAQDKVLDINTPKITGASNGYAELGTQLELSTGSNFNSKDVTFKFSYQYNNITNIINDYSSSSKVNWTPSDPGNYVLIFECTSNDGQYAKKLTELNVINPDRVTIFSVTFDKESPQTEGENITISVNAGNGTPSYEYSYTIQHKKGKVRNVETGYIDSNTYSWSTESSGDYLITINVRDKGGQIVSTENEYSVKQNDENHQNTEKKKLVFIAVIIVIWILIVIAAIIGLIKFRNKNKNNDKNRNN